MLIISGCSFQKPATDPLLDQKAISLATQARTLNQHVISSKGTGWAKFETKTKTEKFKIAWAAVAPDKIRITFLSSGHPVETILTTGEDITFFSHTGAHSKYSYSSKDPDMTDYIKVPVRMSEMILLLLGRFPIRNFDTAVFSPADASLSTIIIKKKWKGEKQFLHFRNDNKLDHLRSMDYEGNLLYEMRVLEYKSYEFGDLPARIELKDINARKLFLDIINFQPNPIIKESVFRLTEAG